MGSDASTPTIAVCAPPGSRETIARHIVIDGTWDVIDLGNVSADLVAGVRARAEGYVLVTEGVSADVLVALRDRPHGRPLIAIGPPCIEAAPDMWLPRLDPILLTKTLKHLVPPVTIAPPVSEPPPSVSWRRKGDMIVGASPSTRELLHTLDRLRASTAPVIVTGESGTGKELVARALHYGGPRAREPFIAINCAAIPENLFEAELFGYTRGAFTGAVSHRVGAFEAAHQGTLFLDELGELPMAMQAKLLRVLETGEVVRLGSNETRKVAVCVVAATNRTLADEVKAGRFREDLFYRLSVYPVHIAPLRTRPEDIAPIAAHYLELIAARDKRQVPRLTSSAVEKLVAHAWPGNVRELVNTLERAVLMAPDRILDGEHIALTSSSLRPASDLDSDDESSVINYKDAKARFEQRYYTRILRATGGNVSMAAKLAQKTRKEIYDAAKRHGLEVTSYRKDDSEPPK